MIFVRLWQFRAGDAAHIVRQPGEGDPIAPRDGVDGARLLFDDGQERVKVETWQAGARIIVPNARGLEFVILSGSAHVLGTDLGPQSWGRLPTGAALVAEAGPQGAEVWLKDAPLHHTDILPMPD
jgi:hypothetical protein